MVEEFRAMKYCNLCSQNTQNQQLSDSYMHQAIIACEEAIKSKENMAKTYSENGGIEFMLSNQIEGFKKALYSCTVCNGEGNLNKILQVVLDKTKNLDILIQMYERKK